MILDQKGSQASEEDESLVEMKNNQSYDNESLDKLEVDKDAINNRMSQLQSPLKAENRLL